MINMEEADYGSIIQKASSAEVTRENSRQVEGILFNKGSCKSVTKLVVGNYWGTFLNKHIGIAEGSLATEYTNHFGWPWSSC